MVLLPNTRRVPRAVDQPDSDDGFTLIEMMVALGIITGVVLALLGGFITSAASLQSQQERARATRVALDLHEKLRLLDYDDLTNPAVVPPAQNVTATGGLKVEIATEVRDRHVIADSTVRGGVVKELVTSARWTGRGGRRGSVVYHTAIAQDPTKAGGLGGYEKSIKSMTISPDPSASVNSQGHTDTPIVITVVMTGHDVTDTVNISWSDDSGSGRTVTATSTTGRNWRASIPAGAPGIKLMLAQMERRDLTFSARSTAGLTARSSLAVWGPVTNPPKVESVTVNPNPVKLFRNGANGFQNQNDVTVGCVVDRLDVSSTSKDVVKLTYLNDGGALVEQPLARQSVSGTRATFGFTFNRASYFFREGTALPWTCVATRASDGGPHSLEAAVTVTR